MKTDKILAMATVRHPRRVTEIAPVLRAVDDGDEEEDDRQRIPMRRCAIHQIKYASKECPLCAQLKSS